MSGPCLEDTESIALTTGSGSPAPLNADLIKSPDAGNDLEIRGNGVYVPGRPSVVGALPGGPADASEVYYQADTDVLWHLRFNAGTGFWDFLGGSPLFASVAAAQTRASGGSAYADLATVGPSVTVGLAGDYEITYGVGIGAGTAGDAAKMTIKLGAAAASDADAILHYADRITYDTRAMIRTSLSAGAVLLAKYANGSGSAAADFQDRWLKVFPKRVT